MNGQLRKVLKEEKVQNGEIFQTIHTKLKKFHAGKANWEFSYFNFKNKKWGLISCMGP